MATSTAAPLRVYLCDLTHDTVLLASDTVPINVGFLGSYARKLHGDAVDVRLFKYPGAALRAVHEAPPDVLALSNYSWNSRLSEHVAGVAKHAAAEAGSDVLTVQGGTNFPLAHDQKRDFCLERPHTDVFVELEGEQAFAALLGRVLAGRRDVPDLLDALPPGCLALDRTRRDLPLVAMPPGPRLSDLDDIPSPYLSGDLDEFFDGRLAPFLETNRGCPFNCNFCHTGNDYFNRVRRFSVERIVDEIHYIGPHMARTGITHLYLADTNFGMYKQDEVISEELARARSRYGWPLHIYATTGKNRKERVIEVTKALGQTFTVHMSVQSMDPEVLRNVKRSNIRLDAYTAINESVAARGQYTRGEIILGLPGETRDSFTRGVATLVDSHVDILTSYSLILLHGTEYQDPAYRAAHRIEGRFRLVPLNWGEYEGRRIFDVEEVGIANRTLSFDDYCHCRGLSLLVEVMHNSRPFLGYFTYVGQLGYRPSELILAAQSRLADAPAEVQAVYDDFVTETREELWDSEDELTRCYRDDANYHRLLRGEVGGNVINRYKAKSLVFALDAWLDFLDALVRELAVQAGETAAVAERTIALIREYTAKRLAGVLSPQRDWEPLEMSCDVDVGAWIAQPDTPLTEHAAAGPTAYVFSFTDEQRRVQEDMLGRYGTSLNGLSKIMTRVSSVESLFRTVHRRDGRELERHVTSGESAAHSYG